MKVLMEIQYYSNITVLNSFRGGHYFSATDL